MKTLGLASIVLAAALVPLQEGSKVVRTPSGTVEFLGLEDWTAERVQAALGYTSSEALHYCAADLKKLGFPESNVTPYREAGTRYTVVTLIEPKYANQISLHVAPAGTDPVPTTWNALVRFSREPRVYLQGGFLDYAAAVVGRKEGSSEKQSWWTTLRAHTGDSDYRRAVKLIGHVDPATRAAAAMVLVHFGKRQPTWPALMHALLDPDETVRATAMQALISLAEHTPRRVDWLGSRDAIAAILRGTNLMALSHVLAVLTKTGLSPSVGRGLLGKQERRMVLALLQARHERERELAYRFLVTATGQDFGSNVQRWKAWLEN